MFCGLVLPVSEETQCDEQHSMGDVSIIMLPWEYHRMLVNWTARNSKMRCGQLRSRGGVSSCVLIVITDGI